MEQPVVIEPRFENPDNKYAPVASNSPPVPVGTTIPWIQQNIYLIGGLTIVALICVFLAFWFRKPAAPTPAPPTAQIAPAPSAQQPPTASPAQPQPVNTAGASAQPQPVNTAAQPQPVNTPAQPQPVNTAAQPQPVNTAGASAQPTQQDLQEKLAAVRNARAQNERQPVKDAADSDLDALMEDPGITPEAQDLAIGALIK